MSNQTFVKKDRISFAQNLNEQEVIAPFSNALYVGPNSAITYDGDSNVASINYLQGVTLSNQYIYADGTYLSNLPTGITTSNLVSTVVGLGTIGYISTAGGGLTQTDLTSSITGLGTFGYISTQSLQSTVTGLGNIYLSTNTVPSTIVGLGTFGYLSTNTVPSTIVGLGTFGYISSTQLTSTVTGLGNIYLSTNTVPSTIVGLGTFGYLSSFNSISTNNISAGNLFANIVNTSTISNTDGIFTNSVSTGILFANIINGSTINILDGISTTSLNTLLINSSTINNLTNICTTRLFTRNLTASDGNYIAIAGLGLNTGNGASLGQAGFQFNNLFTSNVFTSNISAGTISTRNLGVSTLFFSVAQGYQISTNRIVGETRTNNLYPLNVGAVVGFGSNTAQTGFYSEGHFRSTFTQVIQPTLDNDSFSNIVRINGNISSQNTVTSSITTNILFGLSIDVSSITANGSNLFNLNAISSLSLNSTIEGLGTFGYLSTNTIPSTIVGLGTFGYLSTFTGSTNFISSAQGFISSLNVNSLTFASGNGWLDLTALRAILVSTIQLDAAVGNFSSISGNGSQIVALNAISSLSLQSTIQGLGTFGYLSTNTIPSTIVGLGTFGYLSTNTVPSTIVGLGTFGYVSSLNSISSLNISTGNLFTNILITNSVSTINISSASNYTSVQFANSYNGITLGGNINMNASVFPTSGAVGKDLGGSGNFRWNNFWVSTISSIHTTTSTLFVQTNIRASTIAIDRIIGFTSEFNVRTNNLFPLSQSATIGYNSGGTTGNGFYSNISVRSTYTQVIHPSGEAGRFASTIYIIGNLSSQNIVVSSITGDGSGLFNLNAISSLSLNSTIEGLGTFGYLSTNIVPSTIVGLGTFGYLSTNTVPSTIVGLGTFGYLSTNIVPSTIVGLGTFGYLSTNIVPSTIVGLGTFGYLSTNIVPSTIVGLGTFGYISSIQLTSTVIGLGNIYLSSGSATQISINSTIEGLGTFGYISTTQLTSTVTGLGTFGYLSTNTVPSTIVGLGTFGYISSLSLQSTVRTLESYYSIITLSTNANLSVSSLTFVETNTNSTTTLSYRSSMIYVGNNILYGALQYTPQFITF